MLEVGKLYSCKDYFLLLYPDRETAADAKASRQPSATDSLAGAVYWSKRSTKPVSYCNAAAPLLVLNTDNEYVEVLAGEQKGCIINIDWLEIKEISCP